MQNNLYRRSTKKYEAHKYASLLTDQGDTNCELLAITDNFYFSCIKRGYHRDSNYWNQFVIDLPCKKDFFKDQSLFSFYRTNPI